MNQKKKRPADPQMIVVLRALGGAYLLYLAWDLRKAAFSEGTGFLLAMVLFALTGAPLLFFSVRQLLRKDFLYSWQSPEDLEGEEAEDADSGEEAEEAEEGDAPQTYSDISMEHIKE